MYRTDIAQSNFETFELSEADYREISDIGKRNTCRSNIPAIYTPAM
jgi:hypothetical protein